MLLVVAALLALVGFVVAWSIERSDEPTTAAAPVAQVGLDVRHYDISGTEYDGQVLSALEVGVDNELDRDVTVTAGSGDVALRAAYVAPELKEATGLFHSFQSY